MMSYNRRQFVKATGIVGTVGLAGCTGSGGGGGSGANGSGANGSGANGSGANGSGANERLGAGGGGSGGGNSWSMGITREGTIGYVKASAWARVFNNSDTNISLNLNTTGGSEEAFRLLAQGENQIARGTSAMGLASYNEVSVPGANFAGDNAVPTVPLQTMRISDLRPIWVTLDDSINNISDLEGKTVHNGAAGSYFVGGIPFGILGLLNNMTLQSGDWSDIPFALQEGRVDAAYTYVMGSGTTLPGWAEQLAGMNNLKVLEFSNNQISQLQQSPYVQVQNVPVNEAFNFDIGVSEIQSPTAPYQWYVHPNLSQDSVYEFCEVSFNNVDTLQEAHDALGLFNPQYAVNGLIQAPIHPGAVQWYKENDLWNNNLIEANSNNSAING